MDANISEVIHTLNALKYNEQLRVDLPGLLNEHSIRAIYAELVASKFNEGLLHKYDNARLLEKLCEAHLETVQNALL